MAAVRWIKRELGSRFWLIVLQGMLQGILALVNIRYALQMKNIIDGAVSGNWDTFAGSCLIMAQIALLLYALQLGIRLLSHEMKLSFSRLLKNRVFGVLLSEDYGKVSARHSGELMNRLTSDVGVVTDTLILTVPQLVFILVRIVGVTVVLGSIEPLFAVLFAAGGLILAAISLIPRGILKRLSHRVQEANGRVYSFHQESLESLLTIRTFGCVEKIKGLAEKKILACCRIQRKRNYVQNACSVTFGIAMECCYLFVFFWCGMRIMAGSMTYGTLTAVLKLVGQIQGPLADISTILPQFAAAEASAERLMEITETLGEDTEESAAAPQAAGSAGTSLRGGSGGQAPSAAELYESLEEICFEDVSFGYDEEHPVLRNRSFSVKRGEFAAIVGSSGIGKSTVMKLLLSVYRPDRGRIFARTGAGEVPAGQMPAGLFAYVPQGNLLMSGPIWQVVGFADPIEEISMERVRAACAAACAQEFIEKLPMQYETELGERGAGLSEGQMQRLAVARAIYSGFPVLLLDEATSALDGKTERALLESLRDLAGRTVLIVTHRRDTWETCDRILRLEDE